MIPRIIHYCWFGRNPLPPLALKCIESWKKYFPDYEIKEWNEDNFDVNMVPYTREAYEAKKYAFVSDYTRFWILYHYGGIYFDTDVEVIKPMAEIIARGSFMGCENESINDGPASLGIAPGLGIGAIPKLPFYRELLNIYSELHFVNNDGSLNLNTVVYYTTELFVTKGLQDISKIQYICDIWIYPKEYFCPVDYYSHQKKIKITANTYTIHHYASSWLSWKENFRIQVIRIIGERATILLRLIKHLFMKK